MTSVGISHGLKPLLQGKTVSVGYARGMDFFNEAAIFGRITDENVRRIFHF
jgi:hypothetical protein